jgi:hypothetical protein
LTAGGSPAGAATRIGVGLHYDGRWQGTVYVVKDLMAF